MSSALRISLVTETFPPEINGVAMTLLRLLQQLQKQGHDLQLVRPRQDEEPEQAEYATPTVLTRGMGVPGYSELKFGFPAHRRLTRLWKEQRPDVIYVATEGPLGWSAIRVARKLGVPVVSGFHTQFHQYSRYYRVGWLQPLVYRYLKSLHKKTACTLVPTEAMRQEMGEDFGPMAVLGRGIDTELFHPRKRCEALRCEWGASIKDKVYLYVGRLAPEKNISLAVNTFLQIQSFEPTAQLVLVGSGPEYAKLYSRHEGISFVGSQIGEDLARHYASADVFLFPSTSETFGNVVLEAMASGLGVVAFNTAAAGLHIQHANNGMLADVGDESAFMQHAFSLQTNTQQLRGIRREARLSMEGLSWERIGEEFADILSRSAKSEVGDESSKRLATDFTL